MFLAGQHVLLARVECSWTREAPTACARQKNMHILALHERTKHMQAATTFSTERIFEVWMVFHVQFCKTRCPVALCCSLRHDVLCCHVPCWALCGALWRVGVGCREGVPWCVASSRFMCACVCIALGCFVCSLRCVGICSCCGPACFVLMCVLCVVRCVVCVVLCAAWCMISVQALYRI